MVWEKNGTPDTVGGTGSTLQITNLTAKKFNVFLMHSLYSAGAPAITQTINNNTNSVYARRGSNNGGADSTATSAASWTMQIRTDDDEFSLQYLCSISGEEKLAIQFIMGANVAGAANAPSRKEQTAKFVPSPDADITRTDYSFSADVAASSNLSALGTD